VRLPEFEYLEPRNVAEACALLAEDPEGSAVFAGGTDLLVDLKVGRESHRRLVSLRRIEGLRRVEFSPRTGLVIGAMATVNDVVRHEAVRKHYPGLLDAARGLAAEQVKNLATVGGNLCRAVPCADTAPMLLAYGATLRIASPGGERTVAMEEFFTGPRTTVLEPADVLVAIEVGAPEPGTGTASIRQGRRHSLSLPLALVAAVVTMEGPACRRARIALGAVAPTPVLAPRTAAFLAGKSLDPETLEEAGELAGTESKPIDDIRATGEYRLELVKVLTRRALTAAAARAARTSP
jgi:carbon-monoxide dehydrogenase medium subunit